MSYVFAASFHGNPNIGLYALATNQYCLVGRDVPHNLYKLIYSTLKVPTYQVSICGTSLVGVFCAANKNCLLVPHIAFEEELRVLSRLKIKYKVIETDLTALGNNILVNNHGAIINPSFTDEEKGFIKNAFRVPVDKEHLSGLNTIGSFAVANSTGCLVTNDALKPEMRKIKKILKTPMAPSTINLGNPYIKSGIIANDYGFIVGDLSTGYEINEAEIIFGFLG